MTSCRAGLQPPKKPPSVCAPGPFAFDLHPPLWAYHPPISVPVDTILDSFCLRFLLLPWVDDPARVRAEKVLDITHSMIEKMKRAVAWLRRVAR